jgi:DNA-3-methyladenine glycosylase II
VRIAYDVRAAVRALRRADAQLAKHIRKIGGCSLTSYAQNPLEALTRSIVYQQLHGKAAATILGRVHAAFSENGALSAKKILESPVEAFRGAGLSRQKTAAIRDLAARTMDGTVPSIRTIRRLSDEQIIERLTVVRGVGVWTVQMFLISVLGRPDVLPHLDYGVQKGFQHVYKKRKPPKPKELLAYGERWRPYRTVASWYLWRAIDLLKERGKKPAAKKRPARNKVMESCVRQPGRIAK